MELRFSAAKQHDYQLALLSFGDVGARHLEYGVSGDLGVLYLNGSMQPYLKSVMEVGVGRHVIGAETGAGIVHFKQVNGRARAILNGGINVSGVASGEN
jgi:hypothetical protein